MWYKGSYLFLLLVFLLCLEDSFGQNKQNELPRLGVRLNTVYDYWVVHNTINLNVNIGDHNLYVGPELVHILTLPKKYDDVDNFRGKSIGLNFGYRFTSRKLAPKLKLFGQLNFSIFQLKIIESQLGPPSKQEKISVVVENTASFGVDYNIFNKIHLFSGLGFGSYDGFFLMITSFTPTFYVGIDYNW
jgi:hypothetical protein